MTDATPGQVKIQIHQFGLEKPDVLTLNAYAEAASLEQLSLSAGDPEAVLTGTRLDEVAKASMTGITWTPGALSREKGADRLVMNASGSTADLVPERSYVAKVVLRDGRELKTHVTVDPPRPQITLLSKGAQDQESVGADQVRFGSPDDLPVSRKLVFFLKSKVPQTFPRDEKIEVSAVDGSFHTALSLADGSLMLEDANTALGVLEPLAKFGPSAFGPVQARPVSSGGAAGEWLPLGTLVRIPGFKELRCPRAVAKPCTLSGDNLFLAASIAATTGFDDSVDVPADFTGTQLSVPHPVGGLLYVKLRDDPVTVQTLALPVSTLSAQSAGALKASPASNAVRPVEKPSESESPADTTAPPAASAAPTGVHQ